ncbi:MAG TPA: FAD-binding oxidoreductase [Allosphingosinicella sp.]|jgi:D-arginine dehydrogenase
MTGADFLVLGGGIAGLSAAARLARYGKVVVLEAEEALGYHSSGRSVSFSHFGIGNGAVRGMTAWSRPFFEHPPEGFGDSPIARPMATIYMAGEAQLAALDALAADMATYTDAVERIGVERLLALCPVVRTGGDHAVAGLYDPTGLKLEAAALLQGFARLVRAAGSQVLNGRRAASITRRGDAWEVTTEGGEMFSAPILVNAAGAWADRVAAMAGVAPIGLQPKRRTIIVVDPPAGMEIASWPFVHSVGGDFYMLPEAGQILVSPVDEVDDEPSDAAPEEYDTALTAYQLEQYTTLTVTRIAHRWAGLRSFVADRTPTAGFDADAPGFFWLAGQGGYGLQTAPAMAAIVEALATGGGWPDGLEALGVRPEQITPERLRSGSSQAAAT